MKRLVIGIITIIIVILLGTMIFFLRRNGENMENINDDLSSIEDKIIIENATKIICKNIYKDNASQKRRLIQYNKSR